MVGFSFAKSGGRAMTSESLLISLGFALSFALTPISRRLALRIGAIDNPGLRRIHSVATPRLGGPAILAALVLVMVLAAHWDPSINAFFWAHARRLGFLATGALMVTLVGAIDDVHAQRPATKLAVEVVAASIVVCGGYRIDPPMVPLGLLTVPLSIIFIVAVVNAVNLVDGLDGLAVGLCAIISMTLLLMGRINGAGGASLMAAALCGVLLGFLPYNVHPARIFLGDSGALLLGFMVAVGALATSHPTGSLGAAAAPLLALGLPLGELMLSTTRRVLREIAVLKPGGGTRYGWYLLRRPVLFAGDRDHIHHRLLTLGFGHREAVLLLYAVGAGFCLAALLVARGVAAPLPVIAAVGLAAGAGVRWLGYRELRPLRAGLLLPLAETFARGGPAFEVVLDAILISLERRGRVAPRRGRKSRAGAHCAADAGDGADARVCDERNVSDGACSARAGFGHRRCAPRDESARVRGRHHRDGGDAGAGTWPRRADRARQCQHTVGNGARNAAIVSDPGASASRGGGRAGIIRDRRDVGKAIGTAGGGPRPPPRRVVRSIL